MNRRTYLASLVILSASLLGGLAVGCSPQVTQNSSGSGVIVGNPEHYLRRAVEAQIDLIGDRCGVTDSRQKSMLFGLLREVYRSESLFNRVTWIRAELAGQARTYGDAVRIEESSPYTLFRPSRCDLRRLALTIDDTIRLILGKQIIFTCQSTPALGSDDIPIVTLGDVLAENMAGDGEDKDLAPECQQPYPL
ncbi:MAG: hypothetical protein AB7P04_11490 [Bacteriovoracia bacterium]